MNNIPLKLRKELSADPFYQKCCITGQTNINFHHAFIYAGRQIQEQWCILPIAKEVHDNIEQYKERCDWIILNRAIDETLKKYSKGEDLIKKRERLNKIYA